MKKEEPPIDPKEKSLWQKVSETVQPLQGNRAYNFFKSDSKNKTTSIASKTSFKQIFDLPFRVKPESVRATLPSDKKLKHGDLKGLNRKHAKKFKSGKLDVSATLDLHGLTQVEAHEKVFSFINMSYDRGFRKVIIITGKGKGVLQNAVPEWLNQRSLRKKILSFDFAQSHHGGSGALYVLLKRWDK